MKRAGGNAPQGFRRTWDDEPAVVYAGLAGFVAEKNKESPVSPLDQEQNLSPLQGAENFLNAAFGSDRLHIDQADDVAASNSSPVRGAFRLDILHNEPAGSSIPIRLATEGVSD